MKPIAEVSMGRKFLNNVNNDIKNKSNNDNNVNNGDLSHARKYALDRSKFIPNTEESQLAETIATSFNDLDNFAFYMHVVKKLGIYGATVYWKSFQEEVRDKKNTRYEVRNPKGLFAWKFKRGYTK